MAREDLVVVQTVLDGDMVFEQVAGRWIGYGRDVKGQLWFAAWRVTQKQDRAYHLTLHRAENRQAARSKQRYGPPLRKGR